MTGNLHEAKARTIKRDALVAAIDEQLILLGTAPTSVLALQMVERFDTQLWAALVARAKVNAPSETTKLAVLDVYHRRAALETAALGKGSDEPLTAAESARLAAAGVVLEPCAHCGETGIRERYRDDDGEIAIDRCHHCDGRGVLTWDGGPVAAALRTEGELRCSRCLVATTGAKDVCDCCAVCGASPAEECDAASHALAEVA